MKDENLAMAYRKQANMNNLKGAGLALIGLVLSIWGMYYISTAWQDIAKSVNYMK